MCWRSWTTPFEPDNLLHTVRQMKSAASPGHGPHGLPTAVLRALPRAAFSAISAHFRDLFWQAVSAPVAWSQPMVRLVAKRLSATQPSEFRPISVTDSMHRLYSKLLLQMLFRLHAPTWMMHQLGRRGGQPSLMLAHLRFGFLQSERYGVPLLVLKLDLSKAFDSCTMTYGSLC